MTKGERSTRMDQYHATVNAKQCKLAPAPDSMQQLRSGTCALTNEVKGCNCTTASAAKRYDATAQQRRQQSGAAATHHVKWRERVIRYGVRQNLRAASVQKKLLLDCQDAKKSSPPPSPSLLVLILSS
jgi:hypothetical protein